MKTATGVFSRFRLTVIIGLVAMTGAGAANAACMMGSPGKSSEAQSTAPTFVPAVFHPQAAGGSLLKMSFERDFDEGIVGLWEFKWDAAPPFGPDYGTQAWHADGTEITFSGGQDPQTGDVCQGVWRQVGRNLYTLNHIAMGRPAPGAPFGIRVHLHFLVKLNAAGTAFTGTFSAKAYGVTALNPFDESSTPLVTGSGTVTATRVIPD